MTHRDTCLMTGASGFIGRYLGTRLAAEGYRVIGVGRRAEPPAGISNAFDDWIPCDFINPAAAALCAKQAGKVDYFYHLAATVWDTDNIFELRDLYQADVLTPAQLLNRVIVDLKQVVFFSSTAVYGTGGDRLTEDEPPDPSGLYGANKAVLEDSFNLLTRQHAVPLTILRISSVYGAGMPTKNAIPRFITSIRNGERPKIFTDPHAKKDYVYIKDLPEVVMSAVNKRKPGVFNIASGSPKGLEQISRLIGGLMDCSLEPEIAGHGTKADLTVEIGKARRELDFRPTPPETGLKEMIHELC